MGVCMDVGADEGAGMGVGVSVGVGSAGMVVGVSVGVGVDDSLWATKDIFLRLLEGLLLVMICTKRSSGNN